MATRINRKKTLSVYPEITEIEYGSKIESSDLNKQLRSIEESALRAILRGRELSSELSRIQMGVIKSYEAMASFVGALEYQSDDKLYAVSYEIERDLTSPGNIFYDINYGYTTLYPIGSYSKIPRGDKYDGKVSPQVTVYIDDVEVEPNSEVYDALDGTDKSFWLEESTTGVQKEIKIELPPALTKRFNYIELHPFPLYGMTIDDILYMPYRGSEPISVKDQIYGSNPLQNNQGEAIKLYLSPKEYNGTIYIKVTAKDGYIGFSNIDLKFLDFDNTSKTGYIKFAGLDDKVRDFDFKLNEITIDWYFDGPLSKELVLSDQTPIKMWISIGEISDTDGTFTATSLNRRIDLANINTFDLGDQQVQLQDNEHLVLEFQLKEHNVTTPVIRGAKLKYEDV